MDLNYRLSEHFTLGEAVASQFASRNGIDNMPPADLIPKLALVAQAVLEPVRFAFGPFSPSSWYRSPLLNHAIGGAVGSQHTKGEAVDIVIPGRTPREIAKFVESHINFDQLILECWSPDLPASGWCHVSVISPGVPRHMAGTFFKGSYVWKGIP